GLGLYGQRWIYSMKLWQHWAFQLMALKPHKRCFFRRGLQALSLIQQAF
ncbi:MAG: IS4 family transposase, partial [Cyanobacteria bacterium P01_F01_bin.56]